MNAQVRGIAVCRVLEDGRKCDFCSEPASWTCFRGGHRIKGVRFACSNPAHRDQAQAAAIREG